MRMNNERGEGSEGMEQGLPGEVSWKLIPGG